MLVFEKNGKAVAFATFGPFRAWPAYQYTIEHSVYVHKDYRGEGIATKLLQELINIANARGYVACPGFLVQKNKLGCGKDRLWRWRLVTQGTMRPYRVVFPYP